MRPLSFDPSRPVRRPIVYLLSILIITSLACTLPGIGQSAATPGPQSTSVNPTLVPTAAQSIKVQQEKLPPALVETDPPSGSEIAPNQALKFYFNQPMERSTVEAALQGEPSVSGKFDWIDDSSVRFTPDQPFATGKPVTLTFAATLRAANGLTSGSPTSLTFQAADNLRVSERLPKPGAVDVNPSSAVVATFGHPVVALGADPASLNAAFTLQPEAKGRGEWINTSTYIFYPQPALNAGQQYSVTLDPNLQSSAGGALNLEGLNPQDWSFTTSVPQVGKVDWNVTPQSYNTGEEPRQLELDGNIVVTFNQSMDPASVEQNLSLTDPAGASTTLKYSWNEDNSVATLTHDGLLQRNTAYLLRVPTQAQGLGGAPLKSDFTATLNTVPALAVAATAPAQGDQIDATYGQGYMQIVFTAPLADQAVSGLVRIEPQVSGLQVDLTNSYYISISGGFLPSTNYTVSISPDLKDRWGGTLGNIVDLNVATKPANPSLTIPVTMGGGGTIFVPFGQTGIEARSTNVNIVDLSTGKLTLDQFVQLANNPSQLPPVEPQQNWSVSLDAPANRNVAVTLPLAPGGSALDTGLYFYYPISPDLGSQPQYSYLLISSRVQLAFKLSPRQGFVWAVDLQTQKPVSGADVRFIDADMNQLAVCTTDANGTCQADLPESKDAMQRVYFAVTGQPGDAGFSLATSAMTQGISSWEWGLPYNSNINPKMTYVYTDRPIYRPGQTVNFRGVLRGRDNDRFSLLNLKEIELRVMGPFDPTLSDQTPLTTLRLPVSGYGTVSGSYTLAADARPGYYSFNSPELDVNAYFQVAEYRKPEFDLQAAFDKPEYLAGDPIHAKISARYFFDAPVDHLAVNWSLLSSPDFYDLPGGLQTGKLDTSWLYPSEGFSPEFGLYAVGGSGVTGADGSLEITISREDAKYLDFERRQNLTLQVTAVDESNLPVSIHTAALLHPAKFYAGVRPETWSSQAESELGFSIQTVDWASSPSGNHALHARFSKVAWVSDGPTNTIYTGFPRFKQVFTEVSSTDFTTDPLGRARIAFTPPEAGTYQLDVSGENALTQAMVWVGGVGVAPWPDLPNQRMRIEADADEYSVGQTAHVRVPNPLKGSVLALVTVERDRVMRSFVQQIDQQLAVVDLPLEEIDAPNVFVSVTLLGKNDSGLLDFRLGYVKFKVKPDALKLDVKVTAQPDRALPGDEVKLDILVRDSAGKPVQGEFSLALVDKAVLALADPNTPGIFDAFYGEQLLGVLTSLPLTAASQRAVTLQPGRGGGGGGGDASNPGARSNFLDTAAWYGSIETNADGVAEISARLPDNLTTWVADVRGLSMDTRVGAATVEVITTKQLLVRPVAPRFLVAGDRVQLGAIVQNNTQDNQTVDVSLEAPGLTLDPAAVSQRVDVPAGGRQRVNWSVSVQNVQSVDPVFKAKAGSLSDATHTEQGALPVLHFSSPQTFATAGVLGDAGERLEVVSFPRSFTPTGGELRVELAPSMLSTVLQGLTALQTFPGDFTEPVISRLLPNVAAYQALKEYNIQSPDLLSSLEKEIHTNLIKLSDMQNYQGGWGWNGQQSDRDPYITAYALFALNRASQAGFFVEPDGLKRAQDYLASTLAPLPVTADTAELDRQAFEYFVLAEGGVLSPATDLSALYDAHEKLSPWGQAMLAMTLEDMQPGNDNTRTLVSDLEAKANRSATGASWQPGANEWMNWNSAASTTAGVVYALARLDPATPLLVDAERYLVLSRQPGGAWQSSYASAWALLGLTQALKSTGDVQANFSYQASLNGTQMAGGGPQTPASALNPVTARAPLSDMFADAPNSLKISRNAGDGRLYYRAFLQADRPVDSAPALEHGLFVQRAYYRADQNCKLEDCQPAAETALDGTPVLVRLTITVPADMSYVVVEDTIPAGAEIINPNLKTSQLGPATPDQNGPLFDVSDPFGSGWGWWQFGPARIQDEKISWMAPNLPAGTYELTYRIAPTLVGEFRTIPARAYEYYFPDVEGASAGGIFVIKAK